MIVDNDINKNFNINQIFNDVIINKNNNLYRKYSEAQKYRKKSLYKLFNLQGNRVVNDFNSKFDFQFNNNIDYLNLNFDKLFIDLSKNEQTITTKFNTNQSDIAHHILNLLTPNELNFLSIIVHGSQADGNTTNYSDIDVSVFLNNSIIKNNNDFAEVGHIIFKLNNQISLIDPTSHHNIFINLQSDLSCYPESFMPFKVLNEGSCVSTKGIKFINFRKDLDLKIENFLNLTSRILKLINELDKFNNFYLKELLSSYFMLIILEYEIITNNYSDKKTIFNFENKQLKNLLAFNMASDLRLNWPSNNFNAIHVSKYFKNSILDDIEKMLSNIQNDKIIKNLEKYYLY